MAPAGNRSGLPVLVWIHGGAFYLGSGVLTMAPAFVQYGVHTARPFVYVTLNYRLGALGFGHDNVGLWDQRLALEWVRANICWFGGDPDKVTVFGQSAGAASIGFHMLNTNQDLFRGAIMQSGAPGIAPVRPPEVMRQTVDTLAGFAGCNGSRNGTAQGMSARSNDAGGDATLECLRGLPAQAILDASAKLKALPQYAKQVEWAPTLDGELVPDSPHALLQRGKISKIPFICGTMRDEGTFMLLTAMQNTNSTASASSTGSGPANTTAPVNATIPANISLMSAADYLSASAALPPDVLKEVLAAYPEDPALGAPFDTGNETFGLPPQYKQVAAIITDAQWTSRSRAMLAPNRKAWGYVFAAGPRPSPVHPAYLGFTHADDVAYLMGGVNTTTHGPGDLDLAQKMLNYWCVRIEIELTPGSTLRIISIRMARTGRAGATRRSRRSGRRTGVATGGS
jgi:carboxylesterase type B